MIRTDLSLRARYSQGAGIYRMMPQGVARPVDIGELVALIAQARRDGLRLVPRGAGTAMDGSNVGAGVIVDLTGLDPDRCIIDEHTRTAHVSPSLSYAALNARAATAGLRLPPDPSSGAWATLGGMVSTNASGARTVRYGSIRRWVRGVQIATVDGPLDLVRGTPPDPGHPVIVRWRQVAEPMVRRDAAVIGVRYPKVTKNSAGYALNHYLASGDLVDIVIGSEGTLGVITAIELDLDVIPAHCPSIRVRIPDRADLVPALEALRGFDPSALEFLDGSFLRLVGEFPGAAGLVLADFEGDDVAELRDRVGRAAAAVGQFDARLATTPEEIADLWRVRHRASPILAGLDDGRCSLQVIEDGCVPVARLADYLDAVDTACSHAKVDVVMFGHAGDGHVHVNLLPDLRRADWQQRVRQVFDAVSEAVIRLGGTPSGEHGAGRLRASLLERLYGPEVMTCFQAVKQAFDPGGTFNPGVILGDGADPLAGLKIGADAAALPAGIAGELRRIETEARWGERRWR